MTIPKGSQVLLPEEYKLKLQAVAVNELVNGVFIQDVMLTSKAYIMERDERELNLLKTIEELKVK